MVTGQRVPESRTYKLEKLLSENNLCQSWQAVNRTTGQVCFVKTPVMDSTVDIKVRENILERSYANQKKLTDNLVLKAVNKRRENGRLYIEYPFLDTRYWQSMTPELFCTTYRSCLDELLMISDFVHNFGLVHCDLKLSNFLIRHDVEKPRLLLVDPDFLCVEGTTPHGILFGTPDHIAPEILANDRIYTQSDNYSIGVSLQQCLDYFQSEKRGSGDCDWFPVDHFNELIDALTNREPLLRERLLIHAAYRSQLLDETIFEAVNRRLLKTCLSAHLQAEGNGNSQDHVDFQAVLRDDCRIHGLPSEVMSELSDCYSLNPDAVLDLMQSVIDSSKVERFGDYWHVRVPDAGMPKVLTQLDRIRGNNSILARLLSRESEVDTNELVREGLQNRSEDKPTRSYHLLVEAEKRLSDQQGQNSRKLQVQVLEALTALTKRFNRPQQAFQYCRRLLSLADEADRHSFSMYDLTRFKYSMGEINDALQIIEDGLREKYSPDSEEGLRLRRMKGWILGFRGETSAAADELTAVLDSSLGNQFYEITILAQYSLGIICWQSGRFTEAVEYLQAAIRTAEESDAYHLMISPVSGLANLYYELGECSLAVKYGKKVFNLAKTADQSDRLAHTASVLVLAYVRLADFRKAEYWLERYRSFISESTGIEAVYIYYLMRGYMSLNRGDPSGAVANLLKGHELERSGVSLRNSGKYSHNFAEAALQQGESLRCRKYVEIGRSQFLPSRDFASLQELEFLAKLERHIYGSEKLDHDLTRQLDKLVEHNCVYYAAMSYFHILLSCPEEIRRAAAESVKPIWTRITRDKVPLFQAVVTLREGLSDTPGEGGEWINILKQVYSLLNRSSNHFFAMLVSERIADEYTRLSLNRFTQKFLIQANRHAEALNNTVYSKRLKERLHALSSDVQNQTSIIESLHDISRILADVGDYDKTLHTLVNFAVDQTGAERGVLLLRVGSGVKRKLRVAAYVNCDDKSLTDIRDFSMSVMQRTIEDKNPLTINNALSDKRTKNYESIILHNVLSVTTVPLITDDDVVGVLYLDHHCIPSVFHQDDLLFIQAIANFIGYVLNSVEDFKALRLINRELINELKNVGGHNEFVTQDEDMLKLLQEMRDLASSKVPVLITGESGTGKEILSKILHKESPRKDKPLIRFNCTSVHEGIAEAELFGVQRGVATGVQPREGKFEAADGGTMFLDEIGDMPLYIQAKVLRVLEYQEFERVGSNTTQFIDTRFIYATNRDLRVMVDEGTFRKDLYYRVARFTVETKSLRERPGDIPLLVRHFTRIFTDPGNPPRFSDTVIKILTLYHWPGNVRELKNLVERFCLSYSGRPVRVRDLPLEIQSSAFGKAGNTKELESIEKAIIEETLLAVNWNQSSAARQLNMTLSALRRRIKKYNIRRHR